MTQLAPRVEEFDSQELWSDFMQNKGAINTNSLQQSFDEMIKSDGWNETPFLAEQEQHKGENAESNGSDQDGIEGEMKTEKDENGNQLKPEGEEKKDGEKQQTKRKLDSEQHDGPPAKKAKSLEPNFQKMFFLCLHFMTLPQIAAVSSTSPIPIFVKDSNSIFIYINPSFCNFIMGVSGVEMVVNKTGVSDVLESPTEASCVIDQDKWILTQEEGSIKTFNTFVNSKIYQILKQWVTLPDGQRVIVGVVNNS